MRMQRLANLLLATTCLAAPGVAVAQQATSPAVPTVEEIVVTGSRLQNSNFSSPTPLVSLGAEQILRRAPSAIMEVLQDIPAFSLTGGPNQSQRVFTNPGAGQATTNLRGLGATRTLTLVNGRRFVGQNVAGTLDTQVIPAGLVDRVDIVTGGASAAYGSDAVAGAVNFILKDKMEGLNGSIQVGRSQRGDNREIGYTLSGGRSFANQRGHVVFGIDFNDNNGVGTIYSRKRTSIEPGNTAAPIPFTGANRPPGTPAQGFLPNIEFSSMTKGSVITGARSANGAASTALNWTAFDANGVPYTLVRGQVYGNLMQGVTTNYGATPLSNWGLKTPNQRFSVMGTANYDISDSISAFLELNVARTDLEGFSSFHTQPRITVLRDNPFMPTEIRDQMIALNLTEIDIGRVDTDWGGTQTHNQFDTTRFATGAKGQIDDSWAWDAYVQHGRTLGYAELYHTRESSLLAAEYAVVGADGRTACGPLANNPNFAASRLSALVNPALVLPNCVPFNPFGIGRNTQAAIDYVSGNQITKITVAETVAALNLTGSPYTLPAGEIDIATGVEYRLDKLRQTADALQELGIYTNGNNKAYSGKNTVVEGYLEVGAPILRDLPWVQALELNGAVRRTHYETSGWVTTWKLGATYEVNDSVRLRATQSRDIRAPTLAQLFSFNGTITGAESIPNPFTNVAARLSTTTLGNANLKPEIAHTFTTGAVLTPQWEWATGLRATIDYYRIKVKDVIVTTGARDTLLRCFDGAREYCSKIEFDSTPYGVRHVSLSPSNRAALQTDGLDVEVAYRVPLDAMDVPGQLDLRTLANWTFHHLDIDQTTSGIIRTDYAGSVIGAPSWAGSMIATYTLGRFSGGFQARLVSPLKYDPRLQGPDDADYDPASPTSINITRFPAIPYFSLNLAYDLSVTEHPVQIFGTVSNLLDRQPPFLSIAALNTGGNPYDYVGRTFKLGARFSW